MQEKKYYKEQLAYVERELIWNAFIIKRFSGLADKYDVIEYTKERLQLLREKCELIKILDK